MAARKRYSVTRRTRLESPGQVANAIAAARDFAARAGLDPAAATRLALVVEELVANLIEHGRAELCELVLTRDGDELRLTLLDSCPPFDPRDASQGAPNRERGGGVGLQLVRSWADILSYTTAAGYNRLELRFPPPGATG